jgi:ribosomal protein L11 methyltransferase
LAALGRGVESRQIDCEVEELRAFLRGGPEQAGEMRTWAERGLTSLGVDPETCSFVVEEVEDGRWVERFQASLQPFAIGTGFTVHPRGRVETQDGREPLLLIPGRAFGTGEHTTTQLCTEQLERRVVTGQSWLDLGCGTGILLLIARVLGAQRLCGVEIDGEAVAVARNVLSLNAATDRCEIHEGGIESVPSGPWDGVICNISAVFSLMHVAELAALPREGGLLMVSGILGEDLPALAAEFLATGMREIERVVREPWGILVLERPRG